MRCLPCIWSVHFQLLQKWSGCCFSPAGKPAVLQRGSPETAREVTVNMAGLAGAQASYAPSHCFYNKGCLSCDIADHWVPVSPPVSHHQPCGSQHQWSARSAWCCCSSSQWLPTSQHVLENQHLCCLDTNDYTAGCKVHFYRCINMETKKKNVKALEAINSLNMRT